MAVVVIGFKLNTFGRISVKDLLCFAKNTPFSSLRGAWIFPPINYAKIANIEHVTSFQLPIDWEMVCFINCPVSSHCPERSKSVTPPAEDRLGLADCVCAFVCMCVCVVYLCLGMHEFTCVYVYVYICVWAC